VEENCQFANEPPLPQEKPSTTLSISNIHTDSKFQTPSAKRKTREREREREILGIANRDRSLQRKIKTFYCLHTDFDCMIKSNREKEKAREKEKVYG
jgi:hypothetical protein